MTPPTTPKSRRRWLQFSLRTLLFGLLLACCFLGWVASKIEQARKQNRAAEAIIKAGGTRRRDVLYQKTLGLTWLHRRAAG